ncbi:Catechol O-methyltransferase domain-containing protein 1 [Lamellibrachia satsuma]|nr:Catechol O-methyltransferase domain-containing protein 1 [Lamellibrachia satsuma]
MEPLRSDIVTKEGLGKLRKSHTSDDPIVKYTNEHSLRLEPVQKKLIDITLKHSMSDQLGSSDEIQLLQNLCRIINAKKTLDIGVYTGYSAMSIAMVLPPGGVVVACDTTEEYANMGKPLWKEAGVLHKIDLRIAPAKETLSCSAFVQGGTPFSTVLRSVFPGVGVRLLPVKDWAP